ncbi:MAG TPA: biotin/lipoyl-containing protein, partial [Frankiaceae bacterium]|nr:biotin/lipoyl-containing protein [Frankiaceae bacterium]
MAVSVTMPRLGESVTEGTVTRWLKKEGESVQADEPLLEVSTDKVDTEIPAPASGILTSIKVSEDETVEVGAELAIIDAEGTAGGDAGGAATATEAATAEAPAGAESAGGVDAPAEADPAPQPAAEPEPAAAAAPTASAGEQKQPDDAFEQTGPSHEEVAARAADGVESADAPAPTDGGADGSPGGSGDDDGKPSYVTPLVRKLASEHGVDLAAVTGTGVGGRIRKQDVLAAAEAKAAPAAAAAAPAARAAAPAGALAGAPASAAAS